MPLVDAIDGDTYVFSPQAGGDENGFARGAWDWDLLWKRIPLTKRERVSITKPHIKTLLIWITELTRVDFFSFES